MNSSGRKVLKIIMFLQIRYAIIEVRDTNLEKMRHHIRIDGRKVEQIFVVKLQLIRP